MTNYDVITKNAELSYDVCEKCGSLWLDRGELDKIAFRSQAPSSFVRTKKPRLRKKPPGIARGAWNRSSHPSGFSAAQTSPWTTVETAADSASMEVNLI